MININTESIKLDKEAKVQYSMDRLFIERPIRVPTVSFGLKTSEELTRVADQMRLYAGVKNRRRRPRGGSAGRSTCGSARSEAMGLLAGEGAGRSMAQCVSHAWTYCRPSSCGTAR